MFYFGIVSGLWPATMPNPFADLLGLTANWLQVIWALADILLLAFVVAYFSLTPHSFLSMSPVLLDTRFPKDRRPLLAARTLPETTLHELLDGKFLFFASIFWASLRWKPSMSAVLRVDPIKAERITASVRDWLSGQSGQQYIENAIFTKMYQGSVPKLEFTVFYALVMEHGEGRKRLRLALCLESDLQAIEGIKLEPELDSPSSRRKTELLNDFRNVWLLPEIEREGAVMGSFEFPLSLNDALALASSK
jgi:hypothetical protein